MTTQASSLTKPDILNKLSTFVRQRPGFELANYSTMAQYRADLRPVTQARHDFDHLALAVANIDSITADDLRPELSRSRLSLSDDGTLDYCADQYYPVEFRRAACRVLARVLWSSQRDAIPDCDGDKLRASCLACGAVR